MNTRQISDEQEKRVASWLNGTVQCNSGGSKFGGGDVLTNQFFIECKSPSTEKGSFAIKKGWIEKMKQQTYEQKKHHWALAFNFGDKEDMFIIDKQTMKYLVEIMEENNGN